MNTAMYKLNYYENSGMKISSKRVKRRLDPDNIVKRKEVLLPQSHTLYLDKRSKALGINPSEYIRSLISEDMKKTL